MILLITGSRTYGILDHGTPDERKDVAAERLLYSVLNGLWTEGTLGYMTADLNGFTLVEGGCPTGADALGRWWAESSPMHSYGEFPSSGLPGDYPDEPPFAHKSFPANWKKYGKAAGPIRNQEMVEYVHDHKDPDKIVVGFVDKPLELSSGTDNCIENAQLAGLQTNVVRIHK